MTDDDNASTAEDLLQEAKQQRRTTTDAPTQSTGSTDDSGDETPTLADAVADAYGSIEAGDTPSNLTLRDGDLAALFAGLEASDELARVVETAHADLGRQGEPDSHTRATALRLLVRVGLDEVDASLVDAAKDGKQQHLTKQASEF